MATVTEMTKYEKLFSTPVLRFRVGEADALNTALIGEMSRMRAASDGAQKSNRGGWHSEGNLFDEEAAVFQTLRAHVVNAIFEANDRIGARAPRESLSTKIFGWMNANPTGAFNAPHSHPGAHWSGVYYVAQPDVEVGNSGMIEFLDPRTDLPNWRILKAPPYKLKKKLRPMPGEMILFPSYLVHWVYPNETPEERVTIAFNVTFRKAKREESVG